MLVVDNMSLREMYTELVNDAPNVTAKVEDKRIFQTSCEDGVCLGIEKEKNIFIQRTFLTYKMLKNDQIDTFESLYDSLYEGEE